MANAKDDFIRMLSSGNGASTLSANELSSMGKRASSLYLSGGCDMPTAITKIASENPAVTDHHLRRITEQANIATFETLFKGGNKHAEFSVADPEEVISIFRKSASVVEDDYIGALDPPFIDYGFFDTPKTAAAVAEPTVTELWKEHSKYASAHQYIAREAEVADHLYGEELVKLAKMVDRTVRDGSAIGDIYRLCKTASSNMTLCNEIMLELSDFGAIKTASYSPTVGGVANTTHPIYVQYGVVEKLLNERNRLKTAAASLGNSTEVTKNNLRKAVVVK
jgi:hypothetical protein